MQSLVTRTVAIPEGGQPLNLETPQSGAEYPDAEWEFVSDPAALGWATDRLADARSLAGSIDTAALMIVHGGRVVLQDGEITTRFNGHSIRKSLLSALIGIEVAAGRIDLAKTLEDLDIGDHRGLSATERTATVLDLLQARSGIYHPAGYESDWMKTIKPARFSHAPGVYWCYSNWDFNALGTAFRRMTGKDIFESFAESIAGPLAMQDFGVSDGAYVDSAESEHPAYPFRITARDLARFGLLFLREGSWGDRQVVPRSWVRQSVKPYSDAGPRGAYGYMWWVARDEIMLPGMLLPDGSYSAQGVGGHYIVVVPSHDMVVVHRVNTDVDGNAVSRLDFGRLMSVILEAHPIGY